VAGRPASARVENAVARMQRTVGNQAVLRMLRTEPEEHQLGASDDLAHVQEVLRSPGYPLDAANRSFFEPRFGRDFSNVRVYEGQAAARSAEAAGGRAYTVGRDVVLGKGLHSRGPSATRRLLAHELVHTLQQRGAGRLCLQREELENSPAPQLGPIAQARVDAAGALDTAISRTEAAVQAREEGSPVPEDVASAFGRFFPGVEESFLELLLRRLTMTRRWRTLPRVRIRRVWSEAGLDFSVDPWAMFLRGAIHEGKASAACPPDYIAVFRSWFREEALRPTRLIHEVFHYNFTEMRGHPRRRPWRNVVSYQGYISVLGGLPIGPPVERQYPAQASP